MRLARTYDLSGVAAADAPLRGAVLLRHGGGYDHVLVEAHVAGQDDWTTLPEIGGQTSNAVPTECEVGFLLDLHPWLEHYHPREPVHPDRLVRRLELVHRRVGRMDPGRVRPVGLRGQQVELVISYVSDPFTGEVGLRSTTPGS